MRTLCGLRWECVFTKRPPGFFSQDLRVSDNLETHFYVTFSDWGFIALASRVNPYLKLTVRASLLLQIIRGVFFFFCPP